MIREARAILKLIPEPLFRDSLRHLEGFSHVWVIFVFHEHLSNGQAPAETEGPPTTESPQSLRLPWRALISPPRIDAPEKVGVFASRSPHRPNPIGMSVVKLEQIDFQAPGGIELHLSGVDLLDGTPVLDLKPYVPYADQIPDATPGWTESKIPQYSVQFSDASLAVIDSYRDQHRARTGGDLKTLVTQLLSFDPRPTSQRKAMPIAAEENEGRPFAFRILNFDVHWKIKNKGIWVTEVRVLTFD